MKIYTFKSLKSATEKYLKILDTGRQSSIKRINGVWNVWVLARGQK